MRSPWFLPLPVTDGSPGARRGQGLRVAVSHGSFLPPLLFSSTLASQATIFSSLRSVNNLLNGHTGRGERGALPASNVDLGQTRMKGYESSGLLFALDGTVTEMEAPEFGPTPRRCAPWAPLAHLGGSCAQSGGWRCCLPPPPSFSPSPPLLSSSSLLLHLPPLPPPLCSPHLPSSSLHPFPLPSLLLPLSPPLPPTFPLPHPLTPPSFSPLSPLSFSPPPSFFHRYLGHHLCAQLHVGPWGHISRQSALSRMALCTQQEVLTWNEQRQAGRAPCAGVRGAGGLPEENVPRPVVLALPCFCGSLRGLVKCRFCLRRSRWGLRSALLPTGSPVGLPLPPVAAVRAARP